jgi:small-conductance mechanosensitive channel
MNWQDIARAGGAGLGVYLAVLALGRLLKRRTGMGAAMGYRAFALSAAGFTAAVVYPGSHPLERHLGWATAFFSVFPLLALLRRWVWDWYLGRVQRMQLPTFILQLGSVLLVLTAGLGVLHFGYDVKVPGLLAGSGIAAIVLGIAMQDLLANVISGVAVQIEEPFRAGDWLLINKQPMEVMEMNWRATRLRDNDDVWTDIPNSQIAKMEIVNLTRPTRSHQMKVRIGLEYKDPPNRVREVLEAAVRQAEGVLPSPEPAALVAEFADSAIIYEVEFWVDDPGRLPRTFDAVRTNMWYALKRAGLSIPYPTRSVEIVRPGAAAGSVADDSELLARAPVLCGLPAGTRERLLRGARRETFGRGERLVAAGERGDSMFLLLHGRAQVLIGREEGTETVATLDSGDCFGEMSLLTGAPRSATVVADTDCEVLVIGKDTLGEVLASEPALAERLSQLLAERRMQNEALHGAVAAAQGAGRESVRRDYAKQFLKQVSEFFQL